jgi:hypothetical protein
MNIALVLLILFGISWGITPIFLIWALAIKTFKAKELSNQIIVVERQKNEIAGDLDNAHIELKISRDKAQSDLADAHNKLEIAQVKVQFEQGRVQEEREKVHRE